jgi:hypothetical protein
LSRNFGPWYCCGIVAVETRIAELHEFRTGSQLPLSPRRIIRAALARQKEAPVDVGSYGAISYWSDRIYRLSCNKWASQSLSKVS